MNPKLPKKIQKSTFFSLMYIQKSTLHLPNDLSSSKLNQLYEHINDPKNY